MQAHHVAISQYQKLWKGNSMSKRQSKIPVKFIIPDQYDDFMSTYVNLGYVSPEQAQEIINQFKTHKPAKNACLTDLNITLEEWVYFGRPNGEHTHSLEISGMFYPNKMPQCAKCIPSDIAKIKCCASNLQTGKCKDKFIKQTLGAILFPQHYGKKK